MCPVLLQEETQVPGKNLMVGRVKLNNTLLTCDQGNFNQRTARSRNQILVTVVRDTCTTNVLPAPPQVKLCCKRPYQRHTSFSEWDVFG